MKTLWFTACSLAILFVPITLHGQPRHGWVHRNATDTTVVHCWNDSMTTISFPPNSMMGMMFPDSIFCRIDRMPMDSLFHPHDSTFIGWCRVQIGRDSIHFDMMNCDSAGSNHQMQFMMGLLCRLHWDSLMTDSIHRHWHPKGVRGWTGSQWITVPGVTMMGNDAVFSTSEIYSAIAFIGEPLSPTSVREDMPIGNFQLLQNYPNPFNPSTTIVVDLLKQSPVRLAVYNLLGQEIARLMDGTYGAGRYEITWTGRNKSGLQIPSGIYLYKVDAGSFSQTKRMILTK